MDDRTCSEDGCDKSPVARERCRKHYMQWYRTEESGAGTLRIIVNNGPCSIDDCTEPAHARGWCVMHWTRWSRHGDPLAASVRFYSGRQAGPCSIDGCDEAAEKRGWCGTHYRRWHRHGDPECAKHELAPRGGVCMNCGSPDLMPGSRRYCSSACAVADARSRIPKPPLAVNTCLDCGHGFQRTTRRGPAAGPRRCGPCTDAYQAERDRADARRRRARMAGAPVEFFADAEIFERDGWICGICTEPVDRDLQWPAPGSPSLDHIIPLSKGGHHTRANAQLAHLTCNVRKGATLVPVATEVSV